MSLQPTVLSPMRGANTAVELWTLVVGGLTLESSDFSISGTRKEDKTQQFRNPMQAPVGFFV